MKLITNMIRFN